MLIHRVTRRLNEKNIRTANILEQLKLNLAIGESLQPGLAQRHTDELADLLGQRPVGGTAKNLEALWLGNPPGALFFRGCLLCSRRCPVCRLRLSVLYGERVRRLRARFCLFSL